MTFVCRRVESREADGTLAVIGVEWSENREGLDNLLFAVMMLSVIAGTIVLFLVTAFAPYKFVSVVIGLFLMAAPWWMVEIRFDGTPRELLLHRDGSITAPLGFAAYASWCREIPGTIDDIGSFEARPRLGTERGTNYTHEVIGALLSGEIVMVGQYLTPDQAHRVAVQLNLALKTLRDDLGRNMQWNPMWSEATPASQGEPAGIID